MLVNGDPEADSGEDGAIAAIAKGAGTDKIGSITKATEEGSWFSLTCLR